MVKDHKIRPINLSFLKNADHAWNDSICLARFWLNKLSNFDNCFMIFSVEYKIFINSATMKRYCVLKHKQWKDLYTVHTIETWICNVATLRKIDLILHYSAKNKDFARDKLKYCTSAVFFEMLCFCTICQSVGIIRVLFLANITIYSSVHCRSCTAFC